MILPNILFKVISNDTKNETFIVKYCLSNSDKPIDECKKHCISYWNIDFTSSGSIIDSIRNVATIGIVKELCSQPIIPEHQEIYNEEDFESVNLDQFVGKLVSTSSDSTSNLNEIEL
tara:strand:+ start:2078 stop:2428 length:351 start_codon:yes stop_codon:yes gene_type:complete